MVYSIIKHEWLQYSRTRRMQWLLLFLLSISTIALWHQLDFQHRLLIVRKHAQEKSRTEWLSQELKHPHIAAHFGNYAYKKPSLLNCFDPGLTMYMGTSVYLEPHRQNDFVFSQGQETDTGLRFGWLSPAMVCQLLVPLLIIVLCFDSVNGEYEKGTMFLLLSQGVSWRLFLFAKTLAVFLVFEIFITIYLTLTTFAATGFLQQHIEPSRLIYMWWAYSIYCCSSCLMGIFVSSQIRRPGNAIALLLLCWMCTNIVFPRIIANVAENIYPVTSSYAFRRQVGEAIEKGLDGHDTQSDRAKKIELDLLAKYQVDSVQQLPFNFEGYIMQQGETYSSKVYDTLFGIVFKQLEQQKHLQSWTGITSPIIALRNISMAVSGASLESEIDFQQQAEHYRRAFVQTLNNDMRDHSAYGSFDSYKVNKNEYRSIADVEIKSHSLSWAIPHILLDSVILMGWCVGLLLLLFIKSKTSSVLN